MDYYLNRKYFLNLFSGFDRKRIRSLAILGAVDEASFILCLYLQNIFILLPRMLGMADSTYFRLTEIYGVSSVISCIFGGKLADKINNQTLMSKMYFRPGVEKLQKTEL